MRLSHKAICLASIIVISLSLTACASSEGLYSQYQTQPQLEEIGPKSSTNEHSNPKVETKQEPINSSGSNNDISTDKAWEEVARVEKELREKLESDNSTATAPEKEVEVTEEDVKQFYTSEKQYDNTGVRTTLDGKRYTANGTAVFLNGKLITDIANFSGQIPDIYNDNLEFSRAMANSFFISDLASGYEDNGDIAIYITGLAFRARSYNLNNTEEYYDQMVKVGLPHTVVFKHLVKANKTYALMSYPNIGIWTAKHFATEFNEAKAKLPDDSIYKGGVYFVDFLKTSVLPHMMKTKDGKYLFLVAGERGYNDTVYRMNTNLMIFRISTNHAVKNTAMSTTIPMSRFINDFKEDGYHNVDIHMFYPREQYEEDNPYKGQIAICSVGQPDSNIATAFALYPDNLKMTDLVFWTSREKFMSMVED